MSCDSSRFQTSFLLIEREQTGNLLQREAERLRSLDKPDSFCRVQRIVPESSSRFHRFLQQAAPLVIADRLDVYSAAFRQRADGQIVFHLASLDSVLWYGVYSDSGKSLEMRSTLNAKAALFGGVLAGIGASACCLGPLLLLSLGIGGAWIAHLTALEPYRPAFMVLAVLFLGLAFWRLYLTPQSCALEDNCAAGSTRSVQRLLFWVLAPLTLGLIASPWLIALFVH